MDDEERGKPVDLDAAPAAKPALDSLASEEAGLDGPRDVLHVVVHSKRSQRSTLLVVAFASGAVRQLRAKVFGLASSQESWSTGPASFSSSCPGSKK